MKSKGEEINSDENALDRLLDDQLSESVDLHLLEKQKRWMYDTPGLLNMQQVCNIIIHGCLFVLLIHDFTKKLILTNDLLTFLYSCILSNYSIDQ